MGPGWAHFLGPGDNLCHGEGHSSLCLTVLSHQEMLKTCGQGNINVLANPVTLVTVSSGEG